ncbi:MAG: DUF503 domain-containing protein [Acidimicrobiia bacterium]|nr:DUF503 domain-containing protein [Acidimicrobiia bacterium]
MRVELLLRGVGSLKEKRHVITSLIAHLDEGFRVGVSEVDHQDKWQRSAIGVAAVAPQAGQLDRIMLTVRKAIERHPGVEILDHSISHLESPE